MLGMKAFCLISALTFGSSGLLDLAILLSANLKDPPTRIDYCK